MAAEKTLRECCEINLAQMVAVRQPYEQDWEEISRLALPARSDFLSASSTHVTGQGQVSFGVPSGDRKRRSNQKSRDGYGSRAARILTHGMHSGLSPSSSPWFKLTTADPELAEFQEVKEWIAAVTRVIYKMFSDIGIYDCFKVNYSELGCFGSAAGVLAEHDEYTAVAHSLTAGEYWFDLDDGMRADRLKRRVDLTVYQMHRMFPREKMSQIVRNAYDQGNYLAKVPCFHVIERNPDHNPEARFGPDSFMYRSLWWEQGNSDRKSMLRESGYTSKPFWAPRWETRSNQVYSDAQPGMVALPDLRELQLAARRRGTTRDLLVRPPVKAPVGLQASLLRLDPGHINYAAATDLEGLSPIWLANYQTVQALREDIGELRRDVGDAFYENLFMALSQREGVQPLNDLETSLRDAEKYTQLGPVVDRVNTEMLEVAVDRAFEIANNRGLVPPAPKDIQGQPLLIDFVSMLAQAQRAGENAAIERTARFVGFLAGIFPDAAVKFDAEQAIDEFATGTGTPPRVVRSDEVVEKMKEQMAQQQQAAQTAAMAPAMADGAKAAELLSRTQVDPSGRTMLQSLLAQ